MSTPPPIYRFQIVETITDDLRDKHGLYLGLSEQGVITLLRMPMRVFLGIVPGGKYNIVGTVVDRDTDLSPEVLHVRDATPADGHNGIEGAPPQPGSIPSVIQDPWHRTPKQNLLILRQLLTLKPEHLGSLAAAVLKSTSRALLWISACRATCISEIGEEAIYNLAAIANSKAHTSEKWLGERIGMVRDVIAPEAIEAEVSEMEAGAEVVNEVVRQQDRGVRPPGPIRGGVGGAGHAGARSAGRAVGNGGGSGGRAPDEPGIPTRPVDTEMQSIVDRLMGKETAPDHSDPPDPEVFGPPPDYQDIGDEPDDRNFGEEDGEGDVGDEELSPDEVAALGAFMALEAGQVFVPPAPKKPTSPPQDGQARSRGKKRKSNSPQMGGLSYSSKKKVSGPRVR